MGAKAVVVVRQRAAFDEVHELGDPLIAVWERLARVVDQVVVPVRDPRVDHRNADARARDAVRLPCGERANGQ